MSHSLFGEEELPDKGYEKDWRGMPEFNQENAKPIQQIIVSFATFEDAKKFGDLLGQKVTYKTKSLWYPPADKIKPSDYLYVTTPEKIEGKTDENTQPSES